jgi:hypothetical protein
MLETAYLLLYSHELGEYIQTLKGQSNSMEIVLSKANPTTVSSEKSRCYAAACCGIARIFGSTSRLQSSNYSLQVAIR